MPEEYTIKRTIANDKDFQLLISQLDHELWNELKEDQATYDQFNKVDNIPTAILVYYNNNAIACGCFKEFNDTAIEIKRMFVQKDHRGKGVSRQVLAELEKWAIERNYHYAVLETSIHFKIARNLYTTQGYEIISNYGHYAGLAESVCMKKQLT